MSLFRTFLSVLVAGTVLASAGAGRAQTTTYTWVGTSPLWSVPANWSGGSGLNTNPGANGSTTDSVVFASNAATEFATFIDGVGGLTIANLTVTRNAAWSIDSGGVGPLTVTNGPTISTGALLVDTTLNTPSFTVPAGGTLGGGGTILGGGTITVNGTVSPGGTAGATLAQTINRLVTQDIVFAPGVPSRSD